MSYPKIEITHHSDGPFGQTQVAVQFAYESGNYHKYTLLGHVDVTTTEKWVRVVQRGASITTAIYLINPNPTPFRAQPPHTGLAGAMVMKRDTKAADIFRPEAHETLTVDFLPDKLVITADDGKVIRPVLDLALDTVRAVLVEMVLPPANATSTAQLSSATTVSCSPLQLASP